MSAPDDNSPDDDGPISGPLGSPPDDSAYSVGYGKPPKHTRFRRGTSGNPGGRPRRKSSVSLEDEVGDALAAQLTVMKNSKAVRQSTLRTIIDQTIARALKGDPKAVAMVEKWEKRSRLNRPLDELQGGSQGKSAREIVREKLDELAKRDRAVKKKDSEDH